MLIRFFSQNSVRSEILVTADLSAEKKQIKIQFWREYLFRNHVKTNFGES
jgi:hypothetical protein